MGRFYRAAVPSGRPAAAVRRSFSEGGRIAKAERRGLLAFLCVCAAIPAHAQAPAAFQERPPLGATFTVDALGSLPSSSNLFALLDTAVPDIIADRIETGGTAAGSPSRIGAHGSTWTQTIFRVGDADITNPSSTGLPLLMPGVDSWEQVDVATGLMPLDVGAPGVAVTLAPRLPAASWIRAIELTGSPRPFNAGAATDTPPAINRLDSWAHANLFLSGPIVPRRLGALLSATWNRSMYFERDATSALDASLASAFVNLVGTPDDRNEIRLIGWGQRTRDAAPHHDVWNKQPHAGLQQTGLHLQAAWQHRLAHAGGGFRAFGAYTQGRRATDLVAPPVVVADRLREGPVPTLLEPGIGTDRTWSVGARVTRSSGAHALLAGLDLSGGSANVQSTFAGRVGETLNGVPARVWDFSDPAAESEWRNRSFAAFVGDTIAAGARLTLNGGLRFETINGSAAAGSTGVNWANLLPRAGFHVGMLNYWQVAAFGQYGRYAHGLPLADLAYGDPTAPTASIYRWNATTAATPEPRAIGPLVQRLGPGTGGNPSFSSIDPALKQPLMDEVMLGFEARPHPSAFVRLAAIGRREHDLIGVVDTGVPDSAYTTITVPDTGIDVAGSADDRPLVFYNRSPASFGADRYLLTNPSGHDTSFVGAELVGQVHARRFFFLMGATAGRSEGIAANLGFGPLENDASVLGEVFIDPNARTYAQGRLFTERGYTIKLAGSYQYAHDVTLGITARYQDGQHFARLVILPGLNQGAEAVRAFRNGRTRFTFTSNLDLRLQKRFTIGPSQVTAIFDAYNLFNEHFEYEEISVTGATSRLKSAKQPPFAAHVGIRFTF